ncbi:MULTISPECIES: hypothetical protein [Pseudomonas]|uniref:hypothetical protein n=1 Tax=Pseudomonas TaxID=286 RepID=UPI001374D3BD|nr:MULTISPECIES: hypothetical protein [Pseudomonas]UOK40579.1 hypothetical protein MJP36_12285 [Pseudomonas palleroniana]
MLFTPFFIALGAAMAAMYGREKLSDGLFSLLVIVLLVLFMHNATDMVNASF